MAAGLDLSIFPADLRQIIERDARRFAGMTMQLEEGTEAPEAPAPDEHDGDEPLREPGKKALAAERAAREAAEKAAKDLGGKVSGLEARFTDLVAALTGKAPDTEVTADDALQQALSLKEELEKRDAAAADRARRAEVKAAATAAGFADPADALAFVDLSTVAVAEDGTVDEAVVKSAVEAVAKARPYLLKAASAPSAGQIGVGNRSTGKAAVTGVARMAAALKSGN